MAQIYSRNLFTAISGIAGNYDQQVGAVGDTVVIRSMDFYCNLQPYVVPGGFEILDQGGTILWRNTAPNVRAQVPYRWDGRQVMPGGATLRVTVLDVQWHWWISGYVFTPP